MRLTTRQYCCILAVTFAASSHAATVFHTGFESSDGYAVGALSGNGWTLTNAGANTEWIAQSGSASPSAPASLSGGKHPASIDSGSQMLWLSPATSIVSANQVALLSFTSPSARLQEPFKVSFDLYSSPTGGAGQSMTIHLGRDGAESASSVPQFSLTSVDVNTLSLGIRDNGTWNYGVSNLPKDSWLRFEVGVIASSGSSNGTYGITVYQLDSSGTIIATLLSQPATTYGYTLSNGFDTVRILTNSSRTDYWFDNIDVSTSSIPEASSTSLLISGAALVAGVGLCRRRGAVSPSAGSLQ